jgi:hypothetical protein
MSRALRSAGILVAVSVCGCTEATTEEWVGVVTLERSAGSDVGVCVDFDLPHTGVRDRGSGKYTVWFPGSTKALYREIDGVKWSGLRCEGAGEKSDEHVEVLARFDVGRQIFLVRADSTMPVMIRARFDDGIRTDPPHDEMVEINVPNGKRTLELGLGSASDK